ncbi:MAG: ATP-grasp domain-containing protein [bacterium]|nr:ATP-grasp domain-containing protein [bacterium]
MKLLVLHQTIVPGRADETDTLLQAEEVCQCLAALGHNPVRGEVATLSEIEKLLEQIKPDVVFNLVESLSGEDRFAFLAAGLLEMHGVPFTGNSAATLLFSFDKLLVKRLLVNSELHTPRGLEAGNVRYIVKSASEHASFAIGPENVVLGVENAKKLLQEKQHKHGGTWLAEEYIEGREVNLALLGYAEEFILLPPAEILFQSFAEEMPQIIDYSAKWDTESFSYQHTPRRFIPTMPSFFPLAHECTRRLGLTGYSRIDLRIDADDTPWIIDVNPNPCLSSDAGYIAAAQEIGLGQEDVIKRILEVALTNHCLTGEQK